MFLKNANSNFFKRKFKFWETVKFIEQVFNSVLHNKMCESPHVCLLNVSCCKKNVEQIIANTHHIDFFFIVCLSINFCVQKSLTCIEWIFYGSPTSSQMFLDCGEKGNCEEKWFLTNWISKDFQIKQDKWKSHFACLPTVSTSFLLFFLEHLLGLWYVKVYSYPNFILKSFPHIFLV